MTINNYPEKKIIVADIIRLSGPKDVFVIRDMTPSMHAPGPDGDGIIYHDRKEHLVQTDNEKSHSMMSMEVLSIIPYEGDCEKGFELMVINNSLHHQRCPKCESVVIQGTRRPMIIHICKMAIEQKWGCN